MGVGAVFVLVIVLIVLVAAAALVAALLMKLRGRQLHPAGDKLASTAESSREGSADQPRPEHAHVETEQRTRFVGQH